MPAKHFVPSKRRWLFNKNKLEKKSHSAEKMTVAYSVLVQSENQILSQNDHFEKSHNAENCGKGTLWDF